MAISNEYSSCSQTSINCWSDVTDGANNNDIISDTLVIILFCCFVACHLANKAVHNITEVLTVKLFTISLTSKSSLDVKNSRSSVMPQGLMLVRGNHLTETPHQQTVGLSLRRRLPAVMKLPSVSIWFVQSQKHLLHINAEKIISVTLLFWHFAQKTTCN